MSRALNKAVRGSRFVLVSRRRERVVVWFGGSVLLVYDLAGVLISSGRVPGDRAGPVLARRAARRLVLDG